MNQNCDTPPDMVEAEKLAMAAADKICEHVDAVTIFICKRREDGKDGTWRAAFGRGNYYTRYGQIKQWVLAEDHEAAHPTTSETPP